MGVIGRHVGSRAEKGLQNGGLVTIDNRVVQAEGAVVSVGDTGVGSWWG